MSIFDVPWSPWYDLAVLGVDAICAALLYTVYRKKERLIQNIIVSFISYYYLP
jgi:hypothetical protein